MLGGQDFHVAHSHRKWQCSYKTPTLMFGWSSSKAHRVLFCKLLKFAHKIIPTISLCAICITKITQEPASVKTMIYKDHDPFDEKGRG